MPSRSDLFRAAAIITLIACFVAALAALNRRPAMPAAESIPPVAPAPDDLSVELRRCSALGPQDAEDAHCVAVWEENRRRFFGRPARPLPPRSVPGIAAPAASSAGSAR